MLKLMSLEIRKNKLTGMLKGVLITNLAILAFVFLVVFVDNTEVDPAFQSYSELFDILFIFVRTSFVIFAAVLLSRLVIDEYKNNTISLLFMYPIPRKKLMAAKLVIVFLFSLVSIIVSYIVLAAIIVGVTRLANIIPGELTLTLVANKLILLLTGALYSAGISLIPLYFGMRKKSVPATIVSSILIISLLSFNIGTLDFSTLVFLPVGFCVLGVGLAYLSIRKIDHEDIA